MLAMSTIMMPAATMTTMTNAGPIPVAAATKLEPKLLQLPHPALMQQQPQQHHHQHQHGNINKLGAEFINKTNFEQIPFPSTTFSAEASAQLCFPIPIK
ncbi:unnamed protein product [Pieris macdunnoughi]|uniref:Uncharacterized protein n=1 Tax=Pieris macdunnoughi TaxID=345717 RepID=A0A821VTI2_9NEOP|nr:unnamed protein product [Pieris macdunnoughi]